MDCISVSRLTWESEATVQQTTALDLNLVRTTNWLHAVAGNSAIPGKNLVGNGSLTLLFSDVEQLYRVELGRTNHFGVVFVESIDEGDETTNLITLLHGKPWDIRYEYCVEGVAYCQIICCPQSLVA